MALRRGWYFALGRVACVDAFAVADDAAFGDASEASPSMKCGCGAALCSTVTERIDPDLAIRRARYGTGADEDRATG